MLVKFSYFWTYPLEKKISGITLEYHWYSIVISTGIPVIINGIIWLEFHWNYIGFSLELQWKFQCYFTRFQPNYSTDNHWNSSGNYSVISLVFQLNSSQIIPVECECNSSGILLQLQWNNCSSSGIATLTYMAYLWPYHYFWETQNIIDLIIFK